MRWEGLMVFFFREKRSHVTKPRGPIPMFFFHDAFGGVEEGVDKASRTNPHVFLP